MWRWTLDCIHGLHFGDGRPGLGFLFTCLALRCIAWLGLLACLLATSSSDDGLRDTMEIVKIYDYKPAWIARYEGMIIGLGSLHGWGIGGVKA